MRHLATSGKAASLLKKSLTLFRELGEKPGIASCLAGVAAILEEQAQPEQSAQLLGATEALLETTGAVLWPADRIEYERDVSDLRAQLDEAAFDAAWAEGRAMTMEQAIETALGIAG